jgi:transcriptional regulator with XRE-family HTH domain
MGIESMERLYKAFGNLLVSRRRERKWTAYALATAAGMSESEVVGLELGEYGPTLKDLFRIAWALREEPTILLIDVVAEWRGDDADRSLYPSRPSNFERLYRLGYHHKIGDFREQEKTYGSVAEATHAAVRLNEQRHVRGVKLLDTVTTYIRMDYLRLDWKPDTGSSMEDRP